MINVYNVRLDESTVEGLELVKRKEGLDTIDDVMYLEKFVALNKRFTLTWDDVIRKGLEEWDKLVQMDEEADRAEKMRA